MCNENSHFSLDTRSINGNEVSRRHANHWIATNDGKERMEFLWVNAPQIFFCVSSVYFIFYDFTVRTLARHLPKRVRICLWFVFCVTAWTFVFAHRSTTNTEQHQNRLRRIANCVTIHRWNFISFRLCAIHFSIIFHTNFKFLFGRIQMQNKENEEETTKEKFRSSTQVCVCFQLTSWAGLSMVRSVSQNTQ